MARQIRRFKKREIASVRSDVMGGLNHGSMILEAKVKTNSSRFHIEETGKGLIIHVKSPPEKGKANQEIINELTKKFKRPVKIISGIKSSKKRILVQ